jgi:hypothetical protein
MTNDSDDELSFNLADGFEPPDLERHPGDLLGHTGVQWPALKADSKEPPTDVVALTDELLRSVNPPGVSPPEPPVAPQLLERSRSSGSSVQKLMSAPAVGVPSLSVPAGPTTSEALQAIRPRRWLMVAIASTLVVALFGGLLLRQSLSTPMKPRAAALDAPRPTSAPNEPLTEPPLLPAPPALELELLEFPVPAPARPVEVVEQVPPTPAPRPSRPARRAVRAGPATDLLDVWQ